MGALTMGSMEPGESSMRRLLGRIVDFENAALGGLVRRLRRDLAMTAFEVATDDCQLLASRFSRDCRSLLFFRELAFMPREDSDRLHSAVCNQVVGVLEDLAEHFHGGVEGDAHEMGDALSDVMKRLRLSWSKGGRLEQLRGSEG
jgi:hypothetical protein